MEEARKQAKQTKRDNRKTRNNGTTIDLSIPSMNSNIP
jgi:hypothetical protein